MNRVTADELRVATLQRQFPTIERRDGAAVLDLFARLGPIQSQVPRAPFLTVSSRLPGVGYATVAGLLERHDLLKTSSLRGTVHTTGRAQYPLVDAAARPLRSRQLTVGLNLQRSTAADLAAATEAFADGTWRPRSEITDWARGWLGEHESAEAAERLGSAVHHSVVWGHSGLLRRPYDGRWERRTDNLHRRSRNLLPDLPVVDVATALRELVRIHLEAYGPAQREDLAFFFGAKLTAINAAVASLGDELIRLQGPDGMYLDLAEPPIGGSVPEGVRLLPEFDGLLVGFHGRNRFRFLTEQQLPQVWAKVNGLFSPIVLLDGWIVATWKTLTAGKRTDIEIRMLAPHRPLSDDQLADAVRATEQVLDLTVRDLRILPAS